MVYGVAFRYTRNEADAEDVYSETFLTYFKKEREFNDEEHRKAWLIRVTINNAKTLLANRHYDEDIDEVPWAAEPEKRFGTDDIEDLRAALGRLKEEYREALLLFYINDLSVKSIAQMLGVTENVVKIRLSRGRAKLREDLGGRE